MSMFILFVSPGVLVEGAFSLWASLKNVAAISKILFFKISTERFVEKKLGVFCIIMNLYKLGTFRSKQWLVNSGESRGFWVTLHLFEQAKNVPKN